MKHLILLAVVCAGCSFSRVDPKTLVPSTAESVFVVDDFKSTLRGVGTYARALLGSETAENVRKQIAKPGLLSFDMFSPGEYSKRGFDFNKGLLSFTLQGQTAPVILLGIKNEKKAQEALLEIAKGLTRADRYEKQTENGIEYHMLGRPFGDEVAPVLYWIFSKDIVRISASKEALLAASPTTPSFFQLPDVQTVDLAMGKQSGMLFATRRDGYMGMLRVRAASTGIDADGLLATPAGEVKTMTGTPRQAMPAAPADSILTLLAGGLDADHMDALSRARVASHLGISEAAVAQLLKTLSGPMAVSVSPRGTVRELVRLPESERNLDGMINMTITSSAKPDMIPLYDILKTPAADRAEGKPLLLGEKKQARLLVGPRGVLLERTPVDPTAPNLTTFGFQPSALIEPYLDKTGGMVIVLRPQLLSAELLGQDGQDTVEVVKKAGQIFQRIGDVMFASYPDGTDRLHMVISHRITP